MKTDVIMISSQGSQMEAALDQAEKVAVYKGLSMKNALHLRLLTEEMMGMMRSITGKTDGQFWIEDKQDTYELHLKVTANVSADMQKQLLAASHSGKNEAKLGLMDRIRGFFYAGADSDVYGLSSPLMLSEMYEGSSTPTLDWEWSMSVYQEALSYRVKQDDAKAKDAWDELEKSVVAHVADDVKVAIRGKDVEMTIIKRMAA
ncbi:MAG: hypothetical protein IK099_12445 [Clostridia bacterium]|nr:hypothetical protein [Clostridia bacterium]